MAIPIPPSQPVVPQYTRTDLTKSPPVDAPVIEAPQAPPELKTPFQQPSGDQTSMISPPSSVATKTALRSGEINSERASSLQEAAEATLADATAASIPPTGETVTFTEKQQALLQAMGLADDTGPNAPTSSLSPQEQRKYDAFGNALQTMKIAPEDVQNIVDVLQKSAPQIIESLSAQNLEALQKSPGLTPQQQESLSKLQHVCARIQTHGSWPAFNALQGILALTEAGLPPEQATVFSEEKSRYVGQLANVRREASINTAQSMQAQARQLSKDAQKLITDAAQPGLSTLQQEALGKRVKSLEEKADRLQQQALSRLESEKKDAYRFVQLRQQKGIQVPPVLIRHSAQAASEAADIQMERTQLDDARKNLEFAQNVDPELQVSPLESHPPETVARNLAHAGRMRQLEQLTLSQLPKESSVLERQTQRHHLDSRFDQEIAWTKHLTPSPDRDGSLLSLMTDQDSLRDDIAAEDRKLRETGRQLDRQSYALNQMEDQLIKQRAQQNRTVQSLQAALDAQRQSITDIQEKQKENALFNINFLGQTVAPIDEIIAETQKNVAELEKRLTEAQHELGSSETQLTELEYQKQALKSQQSGQRQALDELHATRRPAHDRISTQPGGVIDGPGSLGPDALIRLRDERHREMADLASGLLSDPDSNSTHRAIAIRGLSTSAQYHASVAEDAGVDIMTVRSRSEAARQSLEQARNAYQETVFPSQDQRDSVAFTLGTATLATARAEGLVNGERAVENIQAARELRFEIHDPQKRQTLEAQTYGSATQIQGRFMAPETMHGLYQMEGKQLTFDVDPLMDLEHIRRDMAENAEEPNLRQQIQIDLQFEAEGRLRFKQELENLSQGLIHGSRDIQTAKDVYFVKYEERVDESISDLAFWVDDAELASLKVEDLRMAAGDQYAYAKGLQQMAASLGSDTDLTNDPRAFFVLRSGMNFEYARTSKGGGEENFYGSLQPNEQARQEFWAQPLKERSALMASWARGVVPAYQDLLDQTPAPDHSEEGGIFDLLRDAESLSRAQSILNFEGGPAAFTLFKLIEDRNVGLSNLAGRNYAELNDMSLSDPEQSLLTEDATKELNEESAEFDRFYERTKNAVALADLANDLATSLIPGSALAKGGQLLAKIPGTQRLVKGLSYAHSIADKYNVRGLLEKAMGPRFSSAGSGFYLNTATAASSEALMAGIGELSPELAEALGTFKQVISFGSNGLSLSDTLPTLGESLTGLGLSQIEDADLQSVLKIVSSGGWNTVGDRMSGTHMERRVKADLAEARAPGTSPERRQELLKKLETDLDTAMKTQAQQLSEAVKERQKISPENQDPNVPEQKSPVDRLRQRLLDDKIKVIQERQAQIAALQNQLDGIYQPPETSRATLDPEQTAYTPRFQDMESLGLQQSQFAWQEPNGAHAFEIDVDRDPKLRSAIEELAQAGRMSDSEPADITSRYQKMIESYADAGALPRNPLNDETLYNHFRTYDENQGVLDLGDALKDIHVCREASVLMHGALAAQGIQSKIVEGYLELPGQKAPGQRHMWVETADGFMIDAVQKRVYGPDQEPANGVYRLSERSPREIFRPQSGSQDDFEVRSVKQGLPRVEPNYGHDFTLSTNMPPESLLSSPVGSSDLEGRLEEVNVNERMAEASTARRIMWQSDTETLRDLFGIQGNIQYSDQESKSRYIKEMLSQNPQLPEALLEKVAEKSPVALAGKVRPIRSAELGLDYDTIMKNFDKFSDRSMRAEAFSPEDQIDNMNLSETLFTEKGVKSVRQTIHGLLSDSISTEKGIFVKPNGMYDFTPVEIHRVDFSKDYELANLLEPRPFGLGSKQDMVVADRMAAKALFDKGFIKTATPEAVAQYRQNLGLVWHHHEDLKTMQLLPKFIHDSHLPHIGGDSLAEEISNHTVSRDSYQKFVGAENQVPDYYWESTTDAKVSTSTANTLSPNAHVGVTLPSRGYRATPEELSTHKLRGRKEVEDFRDRFEPAGDREEGFEAFKAEALSRWEDKYEGTEARFGLSDEQLLAHYEALVDMSDDELAAALSYKGSDAIIMNSVMRGDPSALEFYAEELDRIETNVRASLHALDKLPKYEGQSYRGMTVPAERAQAFLEKYQEGNTVHESQFLSSSSQRATNDHLLPPGDEETLHFSFEFNSQLGIDYRAVNVDEDEVVMPPGAYQVEHVSPVESEGRVVGYVIKLSDP